MERIQEQIKIEGELIQPYESKYGTHIKFLSNGKYRDLCLEKEIERLKKALPHISFKDLINEISAGNIERREVEIPAYIYFEVEPPTNVGKIKLVIELYRELVNRIGSGKDVKTFFTIDEFGVNIKSRQKLIDKFVLEDYKKIKGKGKKPNIKQIARDNTIKVLSDQDKSTIELEAERARNRFNQTGKKIVDKKRK